MRGTVLKVVGLLTMLCMPLLVSSSVRAVVDTCTWAGAGADGNFSTSANWTGCDTNTPQSGDTLVFDMTVPVADDTALNNDIVGLNIAALTVNGAGSTNKSFLITGNDLTISGPITESQTSGSITLDLNITLGANVDHTSSRRALVAFGRSVAPDTTFNLSTYTYTLDDTPGSDKCGFTFFSGLNGSGELATTVNSSGVALQKDAVGYNGPLTIRGAGVSVNKNALAAGTTVTIHDAAVLALHHATAATYPFNVVMNSSQSPAIRAETDKIFGCGSGSGGNVESLPTLTHTLSGSLTLQANTVFSSGVANLNVTGTFTPSTFTLSTKAASLGSITTSAGTVTAPQETTTVEAGDNNAVAPVAVGYKQDFVIKGTRGDASISYGGTLKGTGTVGNVYVMTGGTLAPGLSPGCLNTGNLDLSSGTYQVELEDLTACTEYDQTIVTGTVTLGGTLQIVRYNGMVPRLNDSFTIISNDGTEGVTGTFSGLAQGATTTVDGITYSISYTGGDGNDVVLVVTAVDSSLGAPNTGVMSVIRSGIILPILAILAAIGFIVVNFGVKKS